MRIIHVETQSGSYIILTAAIKTSLLLHLASPREIGRFILWQTQIILWLAERLQAGQVSGAPAPSSSSSSVLWYPPTHPYQVFCLDQLPRCVFQSSLAPTAIPFLALCERHLGIFCNTKAPPCLSLIQEFIYGRSEAIWKFPQIIREKKPKPKLNTRLVYLVTT